MRQKGFAPIVILIFIIITIGSAFYFWKWKENDLHSPANGNPVVTTTSPIQVTPTPTTYPASFKSDKYKFSLGITQPLVLVDELSKNCQLFLSVPVEGRGVGYPFYLSVYPCDNDHQYNSSLFTESAINKAFSVEKVGDTVLMNDNADKVFVPYETYTRLADTRLGEISGITIQSNKVWEGSSSERHRIIYFKYNGLVYAIASYFDEETAYNLNYFNKILANFKFSQ